MNILMLSWRGPNHPNSGGAEIVTLEHAKAWVAAGHQVTWFTSNFNGGPKTEKIEGVNLVRGGQQLVLVQLSALLWYLFSAHPHFDLVIDQFHGIPFFTPFFIRTRKLAFIHEVAREVWWTNHLHFPVNYLFAAAGFLLEPMIFLAYRHIPFWTVSTSTKSDLMEWGIPETNITVIANGLTARPVQVAKEKTPTLIFLGAVAQDKGIEDALKAFALLYRAEPSLRLWVVGRGEQHYLERLKNMTDILGITPVTKFWGYVDEAQKFDLLARAHVMLNPSHREGWGLVNIEAAAMGVPVVGYRVPGVKDSVIDGKTGRLVALADLPGLAQAVSDLLSDPVLYANMSHAARDWSKNFTWEAATKNSLALLQNLGDLPA